MIALHRLLSICVCVCAFDGFYLLKLQCMFTLKFYHGYPNKICKTRKDPTTNKHLFKWSQSYHESYDHCDGINAWRMRKKMMYVKRAFLTTKRGMGSRAPPLHWGTQQVEARERGPLGSSPVHSGVSPRAKAVANPYLPTLPLLGVSPESEALVPMKSIIPMRRRLLDLLVPGSFPDQFYRVRREVIQN